MEVMVGSCNTFPLLLLSFEVQTALLGMFFLCSMFTILVGTLYIHCNIGRYICAKQHGGLKESNYWIFSDKLKALTNHNQYWKCRNFFRIIPTKISIYSRQFLGPVYLMCYDQGKIIFYYLCSLKSLIFVTYILAFICICVCIML